MSSTWLFIFLSGRETASCRVPFSRLCFVRACLLSFSASRVLLAAYCLPFGRCSGEPLPAAGFGFGDAVIAELLSDKGLLPKDKGPGVTAVVCAFDAELQVCDAPSSLIFFFLHGGRYGMRERRDKGTRVLECFIASMASCSISPYVLSLSLFASATEGVSLTFFRGVSIV